jgi:hypothetical protein
MKFNVVVAALIYAAASSACLAQSALCKQLDAHIQREEKDIAAEIASGMGDNSAPRETTRQLRISNSWSAIHVAMVNMQANHCPPIGRDISDTTYIVAALACATDRLAGATSSPPSCNRTDWKPQAGRPAGSTE